MTTTIQFLDRDDAAGMGTDASESDSLTKLEGRIDALREQVNFAMQALRMSERELDAIADSLSGRTN